MWLYGNLYTHQPSTNLTTTTTYHHSSTTATTTTTTTMNGHPLKTPTPPAPTAPTATMLTTTRTRDEWQGQRWWQGLGLETVTSRALDTFFFLFFMHYAKYIHRFSNYRLETHLRLEPQYFVFTHTNTATTTWPRHHTKPPAQSRRGWGLEPLAVCFFFSSFLGLY